MDAPRQKISYAQSFISGGVAGMVAKTIIAPFDRIKILFQTTTRPFTYKSGIGEATYIYRTEGLRGLWRGNFITMLRIFPYSATQFATFDFFQTTFSRYVHNRSQKNFYNFIAGSIAGICATIVTYPAEFIRTRMGMQREKIIYSSLTEAIRKIYKKEGLRAFYRGIFPSFIGIVPYKGTGFLMFHLLKDKLRRDAPQLSKNRIFDFIFGATAGLISQFLSYPFDTLRKKMQAEAIMLEEKLITGRKNVIGWTRYIIATEGVAGLYKGVTVNMLKGPIASGTSFTVKNALHKAMDEKYTV